MAVLTHVVPHREGGRLRQREREGEMEREAERGRENADSARIPAS